ncbi:MAG: outer membrane beta-barrel protein [Longimicrobiaceae bacterium]
MIRTLVRSIPLAAAAAALTLAPPRAGAQAPAPAGPGITLAAGVMNFDLSGTGNTAVGALRADLPLSRVFGVEAAVAVAKPDQQSGSSTIVFPEVQLQASAPLGTVAPYLGLGVGIYRLSASGGDNSDVTFSAGAGARIGLTDRLGAVLDGRIHEIGTDFAATTAELTIGLRWRLGSR